MNPCPPKRSQSSVPNPGLLPIGGRTTYLASMATRAGKPLATLGRETQQPKRRLLRPWLMLMRCLSGRRVRCSIFLFALLGRERVGLRGWHACWLALSSLDIFLDVLDPDAQHLGSRTLESAAAGSAMEGQNGTRRLGADGRRSERVWAHSSGLLAWVFCEGTRSVSGSPAAALRGR
jgi:hypothetical protein